MVPKIKLQCNKYIENPNVKPSSVIYIYIYIYITDLKRSLQRSLRYQKCSVLKGAIPTKKQS